MLLTSFDIGLVLSRLFCNSVPPYETAFNFSIFILFQPFISAYLSFSRRNRVSENLDPFPECQKIWMYPACPTKGAAPIQGQLGWAAGGWNWILIKVHSNIKNSIFLWRDALLAQGINANKKKIFLTAYFVLAQGIPFLWMFASLPAPEKWKLAIQEYVKSYNFVWFSPTITPFSSWKTNYLQALPSFQTTEDACTCNVSPSVAFLADIIPECCKNLENIFSDWKIAALRFRRVEMLCSSPSKWLFAVFKQDVNPDIFLVLLFWSVRITQPKKKKNLPGSFWLSCSAFF